VPFAEDDDVIETLSPDATEESFAHSVHPRGAGRNLKHFDAGCNGYPSRPPQDRPVLSEEQGLFVQPVWATLPPWLPRSALGFAPSSPKRRHE